MKEIPPLLLLSMLMLVLLVAGCATTKGSVSTGSASTLPPWVITIPLPQDIVIVPPTNVTDDIKKLSGIFGGKWRYGREFCTILVVERLRQEEADIVYGWNGTLADWRRETLPIKRWGKEIRLYPTAKSVHSNRGLEFRFKGDALYGDLTFQTGIGFVTNTVTMERLERLPIEATKATKEGG